MKNLLGTSLSVNLAGWRQHVERAAKSVANLCPPASRPVFMADCRAPGCQWSKRDMRSESAATTAAEGHARVHRHQVDVAFKLERVHVVTVRPPSIGGRA